MTVTRSIGPNVQEKPAAARAASENPGRIRDGRPFASRHGSVRLFVVFVLLAVGISLAGYFYYQSIKEAARLEMGHALTSVANLKAAQIVHWRNERLGDARLVAETPLLRAQIQRWTRESSPAGLRDDIQAWMGALRKNFQYASILLISADETQLLSVPPGQGMPDRVDQAHVRTAIRENRLVVSNLYAADGDSVHLDMAVPIQAPDSPAAVTAALLLRVDPYVLLYSVIQRWPDPSPTAETLLVRREGDEILFLNELRHRQGTAFKFKLPVIMPDLPAAMAARGMQGVISGVDYRGVPVLAALKTIPGTDWKLVSKVDESEIYAPLQERAYLLGVLVLGLVLACGTALGWADRQQAVRHIHAEKERQAAYQAELEKQVNVRTADLSLANDRLRQEIEERLKTEQRLHEAREFLDKAFAATNFQVAHLDPAGVLIWSNPHYARAHGLTPEDLAGRSYFQLHEAVESRVDEAVFRDVTASGQPQFIFERPSHPGCPGEESRFYDWSLHPLTDPAGQVTGLILCRVECTERVRVRQAMRQQDILFRRVLESLPVGLYLADRQGNIIASNPAGDAIWAGTLLVGRDRFAEYKAWWLDSGNRISAGEWALARAVTRGETSLDEVIEIEAFDGARKIVLNSACPVHDDQGEMMGAFVVIQDITARREAELRLKATNELLNLFVRAGDRDGYLKAVVELVRQWTRAECVGLRVVSANGSTRADAQLGFSPAGWAESQTRLVGDGRCACFKSLLEGVGLAAPARVTPDGSIRIDHLEDWPASPDGGPPAQNACACRELGFQSLAMVAIRDQAHPVGIILLADSRPAVFTERMVQLLESVAPLIAETLDKYDREEELQRYRDHLEELVRLRTADLEQLNEQLRREMAERQRVEQGLRELDRLRILAESRREWQETFDAITDLVSIHDRNFSVRRANRAFLQHFELSAEDLAGKKCFELFHEAGCPITECPRAEEGAETHEVSREVTDPRSGRTFLVSTFPFQVGLAEHAGVIHIARDITEQKEREMKLILSERLASLGQMAAGIAHEINNPLATISACADGLLRRTREGKEDPALRQEYLGIIEEEIHRCQNITSGMLAFVRPSGADRAGVDIHDLLDKTLALVNYQGRLKQVEVMRESGGEPLWVRANEGEVRQMLLALVINALDAMDDRGVLTISESVEGGTARIVIRDSGPGVPPALHQRIFDLFFTTKAGRGGTGLGLPIAHKLALENGGDLTLSSPPGGGAAFTISLPAD